MSIMEAITGTHVYEFPLTKNYIGHWGIQQAVRELLQNYTDNDNGGSIQWFHHNSTGKWSLKITNNNTVLSARTLLLGSTTKAEDQGKRGQFGEGYKLALLVLAREGYEVTVFNGNRTWTPGFRFSREYGEEIFIIEESPYNHESKRLATNLSFVVNGISDDDRNTIIDRCLHLWALSELPDGSRELLPLDSEHAVRVYPVPPYGSILDGLPGRLYVGGLFVCDIDTEFSYDMAPGEIEIGRDRDAVSSWDVKYIAKDMWSATQKWDRIAELMERNCKDLAYYEYSAPELVKEACYRRFVQKHPGAVIAKDQKELERLIASGLREVHIVPHPMYYNSITTSATYKSSPAVAIMERPKPVEELKAYFEKHRKYMRTPAIVAMKELIKQAEDWQHGPSKKQW